MFKNERCGIVKAGLLAALMMLVIMLPSMLQNRGVYIIRGDYVDQYIPRLIKARELLFDGLGTWDWYNYLGAPINIVGNIFSLNFFCLLFPKELIPYAVTYMHLIRFGLVAMSAYAFLNYMVKQKKHALLGAVLYTFSSYSFLNFEFMQFIDGLWAFPLILLAAERLFRRDGYKHQLILASFLACVTSFYFFVFSTISFGIYFLCRWFLAPEWKTNRSAKLIAVAGWEYFLGFLCAALVVLPFLYKLSSSAGSAAEIGEKAGRNWFFGNDFFARLTSFFLPASSNRFNTVGFSRWRSVACYVPVFSVSFVLAGFRIKGKEKRWLKALSIISAVCMLICGVSLVYNMFSGVYTRYAYTMVLFFVLATVLFLEDYDSRLAKSSVYMTVAAFAAVLGVFFVSKALLAGQTDNPNVFVYDPYGEGGTASFYLAFAVIAAVCMFACLVTFVHSQWVRKRILPVTVALITLYGCVYTVLNLRDQHFLNYYPESQIGLEEQVELYLFKTPEFESGKDYRIDCSKQLRNYGYAATVPSISTFESVKNYYSVEMSEYLNVYTDRVIAYPSGTDNELRTLLGVKYYYDLYPKDGLPVPEGFAHVKTDSGIEVYRNEKYMGMGFSYDSYITRTEFEKAVKDTDAATLMLGTLVVEDGDEGFVKELLAHGESDTEGERVLFRSFETTSHGFKATVDADKEEIMYVSVPYEDEGWTATVNGKEVEFIKANVGCMAFKVPKGESTVVFEYKMPAAAVGMHVSCLGVLLVVLYLTVCYIFRRKRI